MKSPKVAPEPVAAHPAARQPLVTPHYPPAREIVLPATQPEPKESDLFSPQERRKRWIIYGGSELVVVTCLLLLGRYALFYQISDPTIKLLMVILVFVAAAVAVALPIFFVRNDPARWQREG